MSSTKSQVAVATNIPNLSSGQQQKDYNTEEPLGRQNSFGLNRRGNMKGKHLTRSHAMREATSPPRTPTPRASESSSQISPNGYQQQQQHQQQHMDVNEGNNNNNSNNKLHTQSSATRGNSPIIDTPTVIVTSQHKQQQQPPQQQQQQQSNVALCNETEFPKLSPPKSKSGSNSSAVGGGSGVGSGNSSSSSSGGSGGVGVNTNCNSNQQRINNALEGHNNNNNTNNNNNNNNSSNKKTNGDTAGVSNETHNKGTNNVNMNAGTVNKNYNQTQQPQFSAGNALQKALNVTDNTQPTPIYNSPMNYQLHPNDVNREQQQQQQSYIVYDKENRCPRNDSQNSMNSNDEMHYETQQQQPHQQQQQHQSQQHHQRSGGGKKHRTNSNSKGSKPRLKNMGSTNSGGGGGGSVSNMGTGGGVVAGGIASGSIDGSLNSSNNTSGFISRVFTNSENSNEQYTDHGGTDLLSFFKETLNKNVKDRQFLLKVEKDLIEFVQEGNRGEIRFPQASSYNRMLIHRTAAFFGMEHNVDTETQQCVIVAPTKNTRIPEIRFKTLVINNRDDSRKSILKRDTHSFDEARQSSYLCPDRGGMLDRKAKSFEEREEDYDRARSRIFNRSQTESCPGGGGSTDDDNNYISWTSSVDQQQFSRGRASGKVLKIQNSPDGRGGSVVQKSNNNFGNYGAPSQGGAPLIRGDSANSNKSMGTGSGNGTRIFSKQDSAGSSNTSWRLSPSSSGTVYHYDPSNMPPAQALASGGNVVNSGGGIYHTNQNNSPPQQHSMHNPIKKQHKGHTMQPQPQQQYNKMESTTTGATNSGGESVSESSTQTINVGEEVIPSNNILDVSYQEDDLCNPDENDECDNSVNGCLSITTTTSTKNYDRIEVQKFKNQATSPNIPINEKDDLVKREHSSQTPINATPTQQSQLQQSQTPQQSQTQNRETPHSSRSTPFSNSDTLTKRSSEEPRATSWTQSYQAPDGSTVFHTTATPNSSATNPYCTTTYQQGPDGSIYAVPQGMIYAYPPPVEGEFQGYFMPVFDPSQQRSDTTGLLQPGTQAIYPAGGATTMVPVAAYPTTQFATTNGAPIYPSQVIYSGEQFQPAPLTATAPASATAQLQQIPMTTYPIGYPYPYNGYWGQTMTYYVPQQAVPATSLLAAPPPSAPGNVSHVAGGVNTTGPNGGNSTAGPSTNSSNTTNNSLGHAGSGNTPNTSHQNGSLTTGYQSHVHTVGGGVGSSHSGGTTYYGTGRIKRPTPPHFTSAGTNGGHQVLAAASIPNGVTTATYQLGHAVPTLTLAAAAPQATAGAPTTTDLSGGGVAPTTATMYALPQHATIFPANMFPYATNAAAQAIGPQSGANMAPQTTIIQPPVNPQGHVTGGLAGQANATAGAIHNPHHSNTVITPFYTTTHHHAPHPGIQSGGHTIHAPGPSAIPIVDPATITNVAQLGPANNSVYSGRGVGGGNTAGTSQSAPSTPHSMPSSSTLHHSQRNPSVFSTPPIMNNNGGNYSSCNSTPHYYGNVEISHQATLNAGGGNNSNSPHNSYVSSSYEKRNNTNSGGGKKPLSYQSASLSRQNSTSGGGYNGNGKPPALHNNNNDTRASPSSSTNSRPHSIKRGGGGGGVSNDKPQTPLLSGPPSFVGSANMQNTNNNNSYQAIPNADIGTGNIPIVNVSKPPIRLNAAAAAFRQKGSTTSGGGGSAVEYRRNPASQRNSPGTNASSSNDNSNNNSPNSIHNSSNAATPIAAGCYAPSYMINAQNNGGELAPTHPTSLYITTAPARGPAHIPPHLQSAAANGAALPAAAAAATASVPQQAATAALGGAAAAAAAADVANAAAVAAAAATVAHHHHHQPLLGTYNPGASGLYFKYGHTYFAHPSVALPNSRRSPSTDLRPPIAQMAGMYPTVNMMIPAQPRHPGRHPNPNYKGTRPR
ncbi:protein encore isoform X3 [Calliphora vicina]|uniref:protein encore isoform X3 n=1 Tax=Calliphora vicina TaxID=7373 RepID=UPI00325B27DE